MTDNQRKVQIQYALTALAGASAIGLATIGYLLWEYSDHALGTRRHTDGIPQPAGAKALIGHLPLLGGNWVNVRLEESLKMRKQLGDVFMTSIPWKNQIETFLPEDVECVMKDPYIFVKGAAQAEQFVEFFGHGIFLSDADPWRLQRKTASNIFNVKNFRDFFGPIFISESQRLCNHLAEVAKTGTKLDIQDLLLRATIDSFGLLSMGTDVGALKMKPVYKDGRYTLPDVPFMISFDAILAHQVIRFTNPFWKWNEFFGDSNGKAIKQHQKVIDDFSYSVIRERRQQLVASGGLKDKGRMDLLDFFMQVEVEGNPPDDKFLRDVVMNYIIAGRDTTAQTTSWLIYELARNPEIEKKMREEMKQFLGDGPADYELLKNLKYTTCVWNETLRLHCNVPTAPRVATQDITLPSGYKVYKGETVQWSSWAMGRSEKIWGPDASEFKPERWLKDDGSVMKASQWAWPVFNCGPRICLGMNMATQEALVIMSDMYRNFHFEVVGEDEPRKWGHFSENVAERAGRYNVGVTLGFRNGLDVKVTRV
ncbi:hypothetical protein SmJEL517_g00077 [Synchytrium microbalum]|uniref:Cytochrome P450 n=1 Tax=Synchytrium microbalum TaxID=1806994 RepID=A0A507CGF1_9FUNG|nr:uncharacterized protein SmJEL517_g00077 [Synchytrium microbalum]TPX38289.1 hypothetical protein SmJEL517_g00077 [Synchytrium microbalum]